jgi:hypothetical protein
LQFNPNFAVIPKERIAIFAPTTATSHNNTVLIAAVFYPGFDSDSTVDGWAAATIEIIIAAIKG